jgi:hypothetical protein
MQDGVDEATLSSTVIMVATVTMVMVYFLMLGLLAELAVKASGMHRPGETRVLVRAMPQAGKAV